MQTTAVPDAAAHLIYNPSLLSADSVDGLWLCTDIQDALTIQVNAAALPQGGGEDNLRRSAAFFRAFSYILIVGADPHHRMALAQLLRETLPSLTVCVTEDEAYRGCRSVTELREKHGLAAVEDIVRFQHQLPPWGLLEVSAVESVDMVSLPRTSSGIPELDRMIGGLYAGELSVWTGRRKEGKSTILGLPILAALRAGKRVCVYSGELPAWRYKAWLLNMAAGPDNLCCQLTSSGREIWTPRPEIARQIDLWWQDRLFLVDNLVEGIHRTDRLLEVFRCCADRCGCSTFVADNLMTVELTGEDFYRAQGRFVGQLTGFAHEANAHVHLVAHRRKGQGRGEADDVSGSAEITNRADNLFQVTREGELDATRDATLSILSNRDFGVTGEIPLRFDRASRRFYTRSAQWKAGWELGAETEGMPWAR